MQSELGVFRFAQRTKLALRALKKNAVTNLAEKEIEAEHQARKGQIDSFFANLKNKIEAENREKELQEKEEQEKERERAAAAEEAAKSQERERRREEQEKKERAK